MRFDWYEYLVLAWQLLGGRGFRAIPEALERAAISRAYYAAFIIARNYLQDVQGDQIGRRDAHQYVLIYLKEK